MRAQLVANFSFAVIAICGSAAGQSPSLPRATPESMGVDSGQLIEFIRAAGKEVNSIHSLMVVRNGKVVTEAWWAPETPEKPHILWSLSKSFTSTAIGFAAAEGLLDIDDLVIDHFPEKAPKQPSENLKQMRIRDLLTMSAGHQDEVNLRRVKGDWVQAFLQHPVPHAPGSHFKYNTPASYVLSAIIQKTTGMTTLDYLKPRLFEPLGIEGAKWDTSPQGISLGGYGLYVKTEDIAKFGQLYLQKGKWNGKQLLTPDWIELATSKQVSNGNNPESDWNQGYGFQFWQCRHDAYRGDGKDGQFCIVIPEQDVVIAITSNTRDMGAELNLVWDKLLPAFHDNKLPPNEAMQEQLGELIRDLKASR